MDLEYLRGRLDREVAKYEVDPEYVIQQAALRAAEDEAKATREAKGKTSEQRLAGVVERYREFCRQLVAAPEDLAYNSKPIALGTHTIPEQGEGCVYAQIFGETADSTPATIIEAEQFSTIFWFFAEGHERHDIPKTRQTVGLAKKDKVKTSGTLVMPRKTEWATSIDRIIDEEVQKIDDLCDQAVGTLEFLQQQAADPDLNPGLIRALQSATPVVQ